MIYLASAILLALATAPGRAQTLETETLWARALAAAVVPPQSNPWAQLLHKIGVFGTYSPPDDPLPATYGIKAIAGNEATFHTADYANLWGSLDNSGKFEPSYVTFVSEDWRAFRSADSDDESSRKNCVPQTKCLYVEHWIFSLNLDGSLRSFDHYDTVRDIRDNAIVFKVGYLDTTDADAKSKLGALRTFWYRLDPRKP